MNCEYAFDDGAYILGALSPAERSAFERHLSACPDCRDAVATIAVLPGLLARLAPPEAQEPTDRTPRLIEAVTAQHRLERRKRLATMAGSAVLAASVALAAGLGIGSLRDPEQPPTIHPAMSSMTLVMPEVKVTAEVGFVPRRSGVEVVMHCAYPSSGTREYPLWLVALGRDGSVEPVGSWMAIPGEEVTMTGMIHLDMDEIDRVELRAHDGEILMAYDLL